MPTDESQGTTAPGFEKALERLKEINERFERGELTLEEAISLYQEGAQLAEVCEERLSQADQVVKKVVEGPTGKVLEEDFEAEQR